MKIKILALLIAMAIPLSSCAYLKQDAGVTPKRDLVTIVIPSLRASSYIVASQVFEKAKTLEDKRAKAEIVYNVAKIVEGLANGTIPLPTEFIGKLKEVIPNKPHWNEFSRLLGIVYGDFYTEQRKNPNVELAAEAFSKIAEGCRLAAEDALIIE